MNCNDSKTPSRPDIGNALRTVFRTHPDHPETARRLARYLYTTDELEELIQKFAPAQGRFMADPECLHFVGLAALALGDAALAEASFVRAVAAGHRDSAGHWVKAMHRLGRTDEVIAEGIHLLEEYPEDDAAAHVIFGMLLADQRHGELWTLCNRLRAAGGWSARMVSAMALGARTPAQIAFIASITDFSLWVEQKRLDSDILHAVGDHLQSLSMWGPLPRTKATVGNGWRIEAIHRLTDPPLSTFFELIGKAVVEYIEARSDSFRVGAGDSPMAAMRPDRMILRSWALAVREDGHEDWHIHPDGWLSGVVYIEVPDLRASSTPYAGEIEFGPFPLGPAAAAAAWPARRLRPRTGDVLLFPSYFAHRTWPTGLHQDRICIAFDILRRGIDSLPDTDVTSHPPVGIGPEDRLVRHPRAICAADAAGHHIVMNIDTGLYLATDDTSVLIWDLLQVPMSLGELLGLLQKQFDGTEAEIESDLSLLLRIMLTQGLVDLI